SIPAVATPGNHQFNPKARGFCSSLLERFSFSQKRRAALIFCFFAQSRTENRFALFLELL
ncbi:hypothetical protein ACC817_35340, partial [Rhizobium ruizarguesonis]